MLHRIGKYVEDLEIKRTSDQKNYWKLEIKKDGERDCLKGIKSMRKRERKVYEKGISFQRTLLKASPRRTLLPCSKTHFCNPKTWEAETWDCDSPSFPGIGSASYSTFCIQLLVSCIMSSQKSVFNSSKLASVWPDG